MLFVSVYLFFNSSRSLLIDSCIFSILFSRFLIIFTIIILNSFSGNFPISTSFIWTSVFLDVPSFVWYFSACFFFFKVIVFAVYFPQASRKVEFFPWRTLNSFFVLVSAFLSLVQWFVWALNRVRFVLSFCLFVFPLMERLSEVVILSADDWVCIFVLFVI